jgi:hypothetical protein
MANDLGEAVVAAGIRLLRVGAFLVQNGDRDCPVAIENAKVLAHASKPLACVLSATCSRTLAQVRAQGVLRADALETPDRILAVLSELDDHIPHGGCVLPTHCASGGPRWA